MSATTDEPLIAGKYRLLRSLAAGGMGALWLAEHVELETVVVVKRLLELRDSDADVARFRREAKAAATLRSRHIVRVHDFGTDEAGPYLVMELLRGQDLCSLLEQKGALGVPEAMEIFRQATKAMRVAHAAGVVHRDIKPSNLFLAEEEGEIVLKVLDFGIAKRFTAREGSAAITASGMLLGSPGYMAPEQVRGQPVDNRADIWALGVVLYEMLTGAPPFYSEHVGDALVRVCAGDYAKASSLAPELGPAWDELFALALNVDLDQRFQTVEVMLHAAEMAAGGATSLDRVFVGAPTLKATSGPAGSLAPTIPERQSVLGQAHAEARSPRTLDASQVPISEPKREPSSNRRLVWAALVVLAFGGMAWAWMNASGTQSAQAEKSDTAPPVAQPSLPGATTSQGDPQPGASPASADGSSSALPTAEGASGPKPAASEAQPVAAGAAAKKSPTKPAATTTKTSSSQPPASQRGPSQLDASQPGPSQPSQPKSSQPKRDPFTGLVTE